MADKILTLKYECSGCGALMDGASHTCDESVAQQRASDMAAAEGESTTGHNCGTTKAGLFVFQHVAIEDPA